MPSVRRALPDRRQILRGAAVLGAGAWLGARALRARSPGERLDVGVIGVANRGEANLAAVAGENVVALCDVDEHLLAHAALRFPRAARFRDFRRMLDGARLDAVVVSTPDHTHAAATLAALDLGLHVYCEKPLTHTVGQARRVARRAAEAGVATQMGTQIHAGENYRRVVELVRAGAIGEVEEVHAWCDKSWSSAGLAPGAHAVPGHLDWDLWLGPAAPHAYHPELHPAGWRRHWAFGGGTLGDMACHWLDLAFWALDLRHPRTVEAQGPAVHASGAPPWLVVRWSFAARGERPPVALTWYDGGKRPELPTELGLDEVANGLLFRGRRGWLYSDYGQHRLLPERRFADFVPPAPTIAPSPGHHREWLLACKGEGATSCAFDYAGALTETVLLGAVAYRTGRRIEWDAERLEARGCEEAGALIELEARAGWRS